MAGEIQLNSTTFATESGGTITVSNVDSATNRQNLGLEIGVDVQQYDADTTKNDVANTFTANQIISVTDNTNAALRVTQLGTGNALVVEDSTNPDSSSFVVDASGNCGIGTSSPASNLHVASTTGEIIIKATASNAETSRVFLDLSGYRTSTDPGIIGGVNFINQNTTNTTIASIQGYKEGTSAIDLGYLSFYTKPTSGSLTERMRISSSGNIGIGDTNPAVALDVVGDIHYTGSIVDVSDRRLKENITDLTDSLNKVAQLEGKSYTLIADRGNEGDTTEYGFIAQNVQEVFPEAVKVIQKYAVDENGEPTEEELNYLGVSYIQLIAPMVEAIKELKAKNEAFESQIDALTARIEALENS